MGSSGRLSAEYTDDEAASADMSKLAISFQAREEEIERKKLEVKGRVESQLNRAEEQTKRLAQIWEELEVLTDPMKKEVAAVRKRIDIVNRELKSLGQTCQKKEKEYKEVFDVFQEKTNEKAQLTATLMEMVNESEKLRMRKLEELSKIISSAR
ncbi:OLC1v1026285C1 [Oldenlandia corymbosa var. corymbosa]|uniref:OLC1v1026285C1 n=1 Tax=Oldenlandia corymbosa var. corymbosa TaxID=529605 RepID=A0AAV1C6P3_OLDCO|nr:OLC1v1026285C1 [Oldenlandia corymbosa var. corymbosa]